MFICLGFFDMIIHQFEMIRFSRTQMSKKKKLSEDNLIIDKKKKKIRCVILDCPLEIMEQIFYHLDSTDWCSCLFTMNQCFYEMLIEPNILKNITWNIYMNSILMSINHAKTTNETVHPFVSNYIEHLSGGHTFKLSKYIDPMCVFRHEGDSLKLLKIAIGNRENIKTLIIDECSLGDIIFKQHPTWNNDAVGLHSNTTTMMIYNSCHSSGIRIPMNIENVYVDFLTLFQYEGCKKQWNYRNFYFPDHQCNMYIMNSKLNWRKSQVTRYLGHMKVYIQTILDKRDFIRLYLDASILFDIMIAMRDCVLCSHMMPYENGTVDLFKMINDNKNRLQLINKIKALDAIVVLDSYDFRGESLENAKEFKVILKSMVQN